MRKGQNNKECIVGCVQPRGVGVSAPETGVVRSWLHTGASSFLLDLHAKLQLFVHKGSGSYPPGDAGKAGTQYDEHNIYRLRCMHHCTKQPRGKPCLCNHVCTQLTNLYIVLVMHCNTMTGLLR